MIPALLLALALGAAPLATDGLRELSLAGEHEAARTAAETLAQSAEFRAASEVARAEAWFTIGVVQQRAEAPEAALPAFLAARDLAGPGRTRRSAMYNIGTILLEQAELVRATIPELAGAGGQAPLAPPAAAPAAAAEEEAPDPLQLAREGYMGARRALVDRLRTELEDGDTRANLELIVRRLRELDDLEQQREDQEQEQQDDSQDKESPEDSEGEDSEDQEQDQEQESQEGQDEESEPQDQEQEEPSEEEPPPEEEADDDSEGEPEQQPAPEESEEELMTSEEIQRLMDRLREIEEQARAVQAMLRRREHVPVEKDW